MNESITEPIIDHEWPVLASRAKLEIVNNDNTDRELCYEYSRDKFARPIGCYPSTTRAGRNAELWVCRFYIAKRQRLLGFGSLYQCARMYDAAVSCFAQYRTKQLRGSQYNFSQSPRPDGTPWPDIDPDAAAIVADMEKLLLSRGALVTAAERTEYRVFRRANRAHKYTQRVRVEELLTVISASIDDCNTRLTAIEKHLGELANRPTVVPLLSQPLPAPVTCIPQMKPIFTCGSSAGDPLPTTFSELYEASAKIRADYLSAPAPVNKSPWVDLLTTDKPVVS